MPLALPCHYPRSDLPTSPVPFTIHWTGFACRVPPFFSHISLRFTAAVTVSLDLCVWTAPIPVFDCRPCSNYCSAPWTTSINQNYCGLCAALMVRAMLSPKSVSRSDLAFARYDNFVFNCYSPNIIAKVWALTTLSNRVFLSSLILALFRWWCGCLIYCWSRLIVMNLNPSLAHMDRPICGAIEYCVCPMLLCHTDFAIYMRAQRLVLFIGFWWTLLAIDFFLMSSSPSSPPQNRDHAVDLSPPTLEGRPGTRTETNSPHILSKAEGSCSKSPFLLPAATFSEGLIVEWANQPIMFQSSWVGSLSLPPLNLLACNAFACWVCLGAIISPYLLLYLKLVRNGGSLKGS